MLYSLGIYIYGLLMHIGALFHPKAKKWVNGRKYFWCNIPDLKDKKVVWFHCASLGEYEQGKPIIEDWKKKFPNDFILITFFSPSGYENTKHNSLGDYTCYLPLDTKKNAKKFRSEERRVGTECRFESARVQYKERVGPELRDLCR